MGPALLIAIWLLVLGYTLVYHGTKVLGGSNMSFVQALLRSS